MLLQGIQHEGFQFLLVHAHENQGQGMFVTAFAVCLQQRGALGGGEAFLELMKGLRADAQGDQAITGLHIKQLGRAHIQSNNLAGLI